MDNYIMVNGVRIDLTPEQVAKLTEKEKSEEKKNPFERVEEDESYYYINSIFETSDAAEDDGIVDDRYYDVGNYCTDKEIMKQHALHMKLNNLLWRFSMTHGGDKIDWKDTSTAKYQICIDNDTDNDNEMYVVMEMHVLEDLCAVYFVDRETVHKAQEEVVKPFIAANPDFDWRKM